MTILGETARDPDDAEDQAARLERLRAAIQVGLDDFARGDFEDVTDLDTYFRRLEAEVEAEFE